MRFGPLLLSLCCLAAMTGAGVAQSVGVTAAVNQSAVGTPPSAAPRTMVLGQDVIHDEKIETNGVGLLQILLADGTSFTVGPNSSMAIDSFVYDPDAGTAKVVATLGKGVFRFIGGKASKTPDGATLNTPVGTVGIRGGISDLDFSGKGKPFHIDMLFGDSITLSDHGSLIGHIYQAGYSISIGAGGQVTVQKTPPGWTQSFQQNVAGHGDQHGGTGHGGSVKSTAIASALGGSNTSHPPANSGQPPGTTTVAIITPPPSVSLTDPDHTPGSATWAEIDNSSLANVYAEYLGTYALKATYTNLPITAFPPPSKLDGDFALDYYFGAHNGGGVATFNEPAGTEGSPLLLPVLPGARSATGDATFGASYATVPGEEVDPESNIRLDIDGRFLDTQQGIAHGVAGTLDFSGDFPVFVDNELSPAPGHYTEKVTGTFGGNLAHTGTAP